MKTERFDVIAKSYENAMELYPNCRYDDRWIINHMDPQAQSILEVSGGTGYLTSKILQANEFNSLVIHDVAQEMLRINQEKNKDNSNITYYVDSDMSLPKLDSNSFDMALNLGGFHHIEEQVLFFKSIHRVLKDGKSIIFGDFADDSPIQRYFDERVNELTETGHQAIFASKSRAINLARFAGFNSFIVEKTRVPFCFNSKEDIGIFFNKVHALQESELDTYNDIAKYFEIIEIDNQFAVLMDYIFAKFTK